MAQQPEESAQGNFDHIPIIDLSGWKSSNGEELERLAQQVHDACTRVGFFYIKNHGIHDELINSVHDAARRFFSLPDEDKMECFLGKSKKFHGFSPLFAELSTGADLDDPAARAAQECFSEAFDIGYEIDGDLQQPPGASLPPDPYELYGDNQWPSDEILPGFRETFLRYYAQLLELSRDLMRIFALALDLPENFFDDKMKFPGAMARMMHYPPQPAGEKMAGLAAHTDYECVTILSQGDVPALQVLNNQGQWILAPPIPGTLVVNIADCLAVWTNNRFKSTIHRVTNLTGKERYTVPFLFGVDHDTTISVLETCITSDRPVSQAPFKAGEYVRQKLSKGYIGYGAEPPKRMKALKA